MKTNIRYRGIVVATLVALALAVAGKAVNAERDRERGSTARGYLRAATGAGWSFSPHSLGVLARWRGGYRDRVA